ncbi:MAG TPA: hypothetical protein VK484_08665 [Ferruginibacter sp.]|nr:hypothetical protein [Ferruginibacter sp.]
MKKITIIFFCFLAFNTPFAQNPLKNNVDAVEIRYNSRQPVISYLLTVDKADLSSFKIEIRIRNISNTFQLAMATHPEYDDRYWRFVEDLQVKANTGNASITRVDSALWRIATKADEVTVTYRIHLPPVQLDNRSAWKPFLSSTGALTGGIHSFMYVVGETLAPSYVKLKIPEGWKIATGLTPTADPNIFFAASVHALIDSPFSIGELKSWSFTVDDVPHRVVYWPLPNAKAFDTVALVNAVKKLVQQTSLLFGRLPYREYSFLFQDGSWGALEHLNSVVIGWPNDRLAKDPTGFFTEVAHEYFHSWNLMRIRPEGYGEITYTAAPLSKGLWFSEGFTMFYSDLLLRRAGIPAEDTSRVQHLEYLMRRYYGDKGNAIFSPEKVSLASYGPEGMLGDYRASTHLQGELIAVMFDLIIRDMTNGKHTLDDMIRVMMDRFSGVKGFTTKDVEQVLTEVCGKDMHSLFRDHISGNKTFELDKYLLLIGLRSTVIWKNAAAADGKPQVDFRAYPWRKPDENMIRIGISDPSSCWGKAGLHTGDIIKYINGNAINTEQDFWQIIRAAKIGDTISMELQRPAGSWKTKVFVTGYQRPEVHISELPVLSEKQRRLNRQWASGN